MEQKQGCLVKTLYLQSAQKIKEKSSLTNSYRLKILETLTLFEGEGAQISFCPWASLPSLVDIPDIETAILKGLSETFYCIGCRLCDIEHLVGLELDPLYLEKKTIGNEAWNRIISSYNKYIVVDIGINY